MHDYYFIINSSGGYSIHINRVMNPSLSKTFSVRFPPTKKHRENLAFRKALANIVKHTDRQPKSE